MVFNDLFQHIPDLRLDALHKAFRTLDVMREVLFNKLAHDKRFEQFQRHTLGQTTLVQFQFRSNNDHRAAGVVNTFTKQVLTETSLLTFEHIGEALELVVTRTGNGTSTPSI